MFSYQGQPENKPTPLESMDKNQLITIIKNLQRLNQIYKKLIKEYQQQEETRKISLLQNPSINNSDNTNDLNKLQLKLHV